MRSFILKNLKAAQDLAPKDRFENEADIDIGNFPYLFREYWHGVFKHCFDPYRDIRSAVGIITEARNQVSHPGTEDIDSNYALSRLHDIADMLGQINAPEQKREVETIRDKLLTSITPTTDKELSFHHVVGPAIDIQTERKTEGEESEFWAPIRRGEFGELFAGKPVGDKGWISKRIRGRDVEIILSFRKDHSYVSFSCRGENRIERRDEIIALFPKAHYCYKYHESPQRAMVRFPVINKGKNDRDDWDEIREKLVAMGTDIYNKINESDL